MPQSVPELASTGTMSPRAPSVGSGRELIALCVVILLLGVSFALELELLSGPFSLSTFLWMVWLGLAAGAVLAFGGVRAPRLPRWEEAAPPMALDAARVAVLAGAAFCALVSAWMVQVDGSPAVAIAAWAVGIILVAGGVLTWRPLPLVRAAAHRWREWGWWVLALFAILVVAGFLRFHALATVPSFVHNDEANDGLQARSIVAGEVHTLFTISTWSQLPMLIHVWYAFFLKTFGDSLVAQRSGSVVLGLISLVGVALLGKELFGARAGLLASGLLALYHDHIHFSRVGIQVISGDVAPPFTLYFAVRALRHNSRASAVAAGICLTLDLHAYFGSRICFLVLPLFLLALACTGYWRLLRQRVAIVGWALLGLAVSIAPLGVYVAHNWDEFTSHTQHETILSKAPDIQIQLTALFGTHDLGVMFRTELWRTILTFFFTGDGGLQYGIDRPMLDPVSSALLLAAIAYAFFRCREPGFSLCLIAFVCVLLIGGAITINMPYWPRLIVILPFAALLTAALLDALWQALERVPALAAPAGMLALALLAAVAYGNYRWYFAYFVPTWRQNFIAASMDVGMYLRRAPAGSYVYGIANGTYFLDNEGVRFLAPGVHLCTVPTGLDFSTCPRMPTDRSIFIVFPAGAPYLPRLRAMYPRLRLHILHTYNLEQSIYVYAPQFWPTST